MFRSRNHGRDRQPVRAYHCPRRTGRRRESRVENDAAWRGGAAVRGHHYVEEVRGADDFGHEDVVWSRVNRFRCAQLTDAAIVHHQDAIGQRQGLGLIVGDVNRRDLEVVLQLANFRAGFIAQAGIEIGQRFVEQQNGRFVDDGSGDGDALLLAAGELLR